MTQVTGEEDEREDGDADERVRRDFAQDVAGENPHARPVKARIAWEACAKRRSLSEVVTIRASPGRRPEWLMAGVLEGLSRVRIVCGERLHHRGHRGSLRTHSASPQTGSAWLRLRGTAEGGRRHMTFFGLRGLEEQCRQRGQR